MPWSGWRRPHSKPDYTDPTLDLRNGTPKVLALECAPGPLTMPQFLRHNPKSQQTQDGALIQPLMSSAALSKQLNLSEPVFSSLE